MLQSFSRIPAIEAETCVPWPSTKSPPSTKLMYCTTYRSRVDSTPGQGTHLANDGPKL